MSEELFSFVSEQLELSTSLDRLESRGTLRIVLKRSGTEARTVTRKQVCAAVDQVLPSELEIRGVGDAQAICAALIEQVLGEPEDRWRTAQDVDEIFGRLGNS